MAKLFFSLFLLILQQTTPGSSHHYCACVAFKSNTLHVQYCKRCPNTDFYDDDRRRSRNFLHSSEEKSLLESVRNTIKRQAHDPYRCLEANYNNYKFYDDGGLCKQLNHISTTLDKQSTTVSSAEVEDTFTHRHTSPKLGNSTDTTTFASTVFDPNKKGINNNKVNGDTANKKGKKHGKITENEETNSGSVSAGLTAALCVIFFLLGLLVMWIVMKFCIRFVIQDVRDQITREKHNVPDMQTMQLNIDTTANTDPAEQGLARHPADSIPASSHRTSYEGLRPENRTDGVYNAINPDYQTTESTDNNAGVPNTAHDYFVLEKEENTCADNDKRLVNNDEIYKQKPVIPTAPDYFILEKENTNASDGNIDENDNGINTDADQTAHDYFVLEKDHVAYSRTHNDANNDDLDHTTADYFILEKEEGLDIQDR